MLLLPLLEFMAFLIKYVWSKIVSFHGGQPWIIAMVVNVISTNTLSGGLPSTVGLMSSIEKFDIWSAFISDPIPSEINLLPKLQDLRAFYWVCVCACCYWCLIFVIYSISGDFRVDLWIYCSQHIFNWWELNRADCLGDDLEVICGCCKACHEDEDNGR